jgi:hypothetical protein
MSAANCTCTPAMGMMNFHVALVIGSILIVHFLVVQLARAGILKISQVGKVSLG